MKKITTLILTIFTVSQAIAGGGWTPPKGNGFFMLSQRYIGGANLFDSRANVIKSPFAFASTTNIFAEYGITNRFAVLAYSPFITMVGQKAGTDSSGNTYLADKVTGFGDVDIALKYNLRNEQNGSVSISYWAGINTGNYFAGATKKLHLGDDDFSHMLRIDASQAFKKTWVNFYGGYNKRTNGFSDDVRVGGEFGFKRKSLLLLLKIDTKTSLFNGNRADSDYPGIYSNNQEFFGITPQIMYIFKNNFGVSLDIGMAVYARNIIAAPSLQVGVFYDLKRKAKK